MVQLAALVAGRNATTPVEAQLSAHADDRAKLGKIWTGRKPTDHRKPELVYTTAQQPAYSSQIESTRNRVHDCATRDTAAVEHHSLRFIFAAKARSFSPKPRHDGRRRSKELRASQKGPLASVIFSRQSQHRNYVESSIPCSRPSLPALVLAFKPPSPVLSISLLQIQQPSAVALGNPPQNFVLASCMTPHSPKHSLSLSLRQDCDLRRGLARLRAGVLPHGESRPHGRDGGRKALSGGRGQRQGRGLLGAGLGLGPHGAAARGERVCAS
jgi:hypothetical protein